MTFIIQAAEELALPNNILLCPASVCVHFHILVDKCLVPLEGVNLNSFFFI